MKDKLPVWIKCINNININKKYKVQLPIGYFANVIALNEDIGVAISTDGVGTKVLISQMLDNYSTIGIDCVAMNVNDIICVGAEPISMVDYIAIEDENSYILEEIMKGLIEGCNLAGITLCGGEVAQVPELLSGIKNKIAFDLSGTAIGVVQLDKIIIGEEVEEGDVVIGLASSGIHSNGLTLARQVLFKKANLSPTTFLKELNKTIGEELLTPTLIYSKPVMELIKSNTVIKALIHITGGGFLNLKRIKRKKMGYVIDYDFTNIPFIFNLIQRLGNLKDKEMFTTYNMGIGFCIITEKNHIDKIISTCKNYNIIAEVIGYLINDLKERIYIKKKDIYI